MDSTETVTTDVYSKAGARTVTIGELGISEFETTRSPKINSLSDLRKALLNYTDISSDDRKVILSEFFNWDYLVFANMDMLALAIVTSKRSNGQLNSNIINSDFVTNSLNTYLLNADIDVELLDSSKYLEYKADLIRYFDAVTNFRQGS